MIDVTLDQIPAEDRAEVRTYTRTHGGAIVLRVGDLLGSEAKRAMLDYRKEHGELPPYDLVWCEAPPTPWAFDSDLEVFVCAACGAWKPAQDEEETHNRTCRFA